MSTDRELTAETLRTLIEADLRRGHTRIAVRHLLMLRRLRTVLPIELESGLSRCLVSIAPRDVKRIESEAESWADMVGIRAW